MPDLSWSWKSLMSRSPLTDPRSLLGSLVVHGALLILASLVALSAVVPAAPDLPRTLSGELDAVDNRPVQEGGGSPGTLGGEGLVAALPTADGTAPGGATRDPAADALLAEILPAPAASDSQRALPGPQITGLGVLSGPGLGGGGGQGGGSGGGIGRGIGPGTEFFGARDHASSFTYVIDCSGSMATRNALEIAKHELLASLNQLPPDARFGLIFYNLSAFNPLDPQGKPGLLTATAANKDLVRRQLAPVVPDGGTEHMLALNAALSLHTEVIFFLTDADLMTNSDVTDVLSRSGSTRIQCIEFGRGLDLGGGGPLRRLAGGSGGTYRYIDVTRFPQTVR
jgi:hypothetical protein